jgi:hypothetical protein
MRTHGRLPCVQAGALQRLSVNRRLPRAEPVMGSSVRFRTQEHQHYRRDAVHHSSHEKGPVGIERDQYP